MEQLAKMSESKRALRDVYYIWRGYNITSQNIHSVNTAKITVISPDYLVWKFCGYGKVANFLVLWSICNI